MKARRGQHGAITSTTCGHSACPCVVALNRFPGDSAEELQAAAEIAKEAGAYATAEYAGFTDGGEGGMALAEAVAPRHR